MLDETNGDLQVNFPEPENPEETKNAAKETVDAAAEAPKLLEEPKKIKAPKPPKAEKKAKKKEPKTRKPGFKKKVALAAVLAFIILAAIGGWVYSAYFVDHSVEVTAKMVLRGDIKDIVSATGKVEAGQMAGVFALKDGTIQDVAVKEGDTVNAGQTLVIMNGGDTVTAPMAGRVVNVTAKNSDKIVGLSQTITVPGTTIPSTTTTIDPTTGQPVTTPTTTVGPPTTTTQSSPNPTLLMSIANMDPTYVVAQVDETDISRIKVTQAVDMVLDAYPTKTVKGEVVEIGLVATDTQTGGTAFPVKIKVTQAKDIDLRIGMTADVEIVVKKIADALRVPVVAVTTEDGKDVVYLIKKKKAQKTTIKVGLLSGDFYEVKAGISEGEEVVVKGVDKLKGEDSVDVKVKR
jgi:multidrug efflux pump subunit AcrA (membrane-fusion protein)